MGSPVRWIRETSDLAHCMERIGPGPLALDTEADSLHHYPEKVCLIQLSFAGEDLLVDPLAGIDLDVMRPVLEDRSVRKILHGADYDLRALRRDFDLTIAGIFDTMIAARLVGELSFGLAALLEKFFGVGLDKKFQRADWSMRPLSAEMEAYALLDTRHLESLAALIERRLVDLDRASWAAEEFRRLERVRWGETGEAETFRKVRGSVALERRELGVLRELHALRERIALERDRPPFKILRDEILISLATVQPLHRGDLEKLPRFPKAWAGGGRSRELVAAVERALALPADELPAIKRKTRRRRSTDFEGRLRRLCASRDERARELGIEPSVLASRANLESTLDAVARGGCAADVPEFRRWQIAQLAETLEAISGLIRLSADPGRIMTEGPQREDPW